MLEMHHLCKTFYPNTLSEKVAIRDLSVTFHDGDFVTVIGGNGAGKSTLLNLIAGVFPLDYGQILLDGSDLAKLPEHQRARVLGRVFQDPMMGTAADMGIEENLAMAYRRGKKRGLGWGITAAERELFRERLATLGLGLENRLQDKAGLLSGGQRQALTLLMATLQQPKLLLLDEHTAALDPATAKTVLELSEEIIAAHHLTAMMVTHNMKDAIRYGNRLIMMDGGKIILDIAGEEKKRLTKAELLEKFAEVSGNAIESDQVLLA